MISGNEITPVDDKEFKALIKSFNLLYHPDKNPTYTAFYNKLYQAVSSFINNDKDSALFNWDDRTECSKIYTAHSINGDIRTTERVRVGFDIPIPKINPAVISSELLQKTYGLSEEDIQSINQKFNRHMIAFIKLFIELTDSRTHIQRIFMSHKRLESDLLFLLSRTHDNLLDTLNSVKNMPINFFSIENDAREITNSIKTLLNTYLSRKEFNLNLIQIYLTIVAQDKKSNNSWLFDKETYDELSRIILKVPLVISLYLFYLLCVVWALYMSLVGTMFCIDPFESFTLLAASPAASAAFLVGVLMLITCLYFNIDIFNIALDYVEIMATFIDKLVNRIFHVYPHATALAELLAKCEKPMSTVNKDLGFFKETSASETASNAPKTLFMDID